MYSPRATQLYAELSSILNGLNIRVEKITAELKKGPGANSPLVSTEISKVHEVTMNYHRYLARVSMGPDGPPENNGFPAEPATHTWKDLISQAYAVRTMFTQWNVVQNQVREQITAKPQKLYPTLPRTYTAQFRQTGLQDQIFDSLHRLLNPNPQSEEMIKLGGHADIPLAQSAFIRHIHAARRVTRAQFPSRRANFLDVGCGGGLKVLSAAQCFDPAEGLDFDPAYVEVGQKLMAATGQKATSIFKADALSFERYDEYDVIYFFRPLKDLDLLMAMEQHIATTARAGTVLIAPYDGFQNRYKALGCGHVAGQIYVTQTKQREATALRRQAEQTGVAILGQLKGMPTLWDPIIKTVRENGFGYP